MGYSVDLALHVADAVKAELKLPALTLNLVPVTSQNRIALVQNGTVDLECGSTSHTRERARQYDSKHLDLAKSHLDAIDLILTKGIKGDGGKVGAELVAKLERRVAELIG